LDLLSEDPTPLLRAIRPSHLLHLAWDVTPGRYWTATENLDWVAASLRLYRAFIAAGGDRVTVAGTCAEYDWTGPLLHETTTPLRPATLYGVAKHSVHQLLAASGANLAWGRVFFLFGPHEAPSRLVPSVIAPLLRGEPALVGDGAVERDFMHVADVASALVTMLDSTHVGAANVATGTCRPLRALVQEIADRLGRRDLVHFGARPSPPREPAQLAANTDVLDGLGFQSKFSFDAAIDNTIAWWRGFIS
jgi:nucleoside-diphosphate-sugar epimerase